jgi:hypothetical protein
VPTPALDVDLDPGRNTVTQELIDRCRLDLRGGRLLRNGVIEHEVVVAVEPLRETQHAGAIAHRLRHDLGGVAVEDEVLPQPLVHSTSTSSTMTAITSAAMAMVRVFMTGFCPGTRAVKRAPGQRAFSGGPGPMETSRAQGPAACQVTDEEMPTTYRRTILS